MVLFYLRGIFQVFAQQVICRVTKHAALVLTPAQNVCKKLGQILMVWNVTTNQTISITVCMVENNAVAREHFPQRTYSFLLDAKAGFDIQVKTKRQIFLYRYVSSMYHCTICERVNAVPRAPQMLVDIMYFFCLPGREFFRAQW